MDIIYARTHAHERTMAGVRLAPDYFLSAIEGCNASVRLEVELIDGSVLVATLALGKHGFHVDSAVADEVVDEWLNDDGEECPVSEIQIDGVTYDFVFSEDSERTWRAGSDGNSMCLELRDGSELVFRDRRAEDSEAGAITLDNWTWHCVMEEEV